MGNNIFIQQKEILLVPTACDLIDLIAKKTSFVETLQKENFGTDNKLACKLKDKLIDVVEKLDN